MVKERAGSNVFVTSMVNCERIIDVVICFPCYALYGGEEGEKKGSISIVHGVSI